MENLTKDSQLARRFGMHEIVLNGDGAVQNPFDTDGIVVFTPPSVARNRITVRAFYDGGNIWRARLYVSETGRWKWAAESDDDSLLHGQNGEFKGVESDLQGKLRKHPGNTTQWITDSGDTFLNLSDAAYLLFRSSKDPVQPVTDKTFREYV